MPLDIVSAKTATTTRQDAASTLTATADVAFRAFVDAASCRVNRDCRRQSMPLDIVSAKTATTTRQDAASTLTATADGAFRAFGFLAPGTQHLVPAAQYLPFHKLTYWRAMRVLGQENENCGKLFCQ